ncbi:glycoside hydrolase family 15 protein [Occultella glacieicola]|uniref:Glycoside hydrolase family 15 protein n=1 Tax=Occultella glacieicola TaxID=2518684 RepID=A0ABY2E206_9MICO|nr:glycoside hydrolase family 15 protein [Occultella glacieicola]TDE90422.1 glycoside hydrolase family 15 protein [Occultella glacieicola]
MSSPPPPAAPPTPIEDYAVLGDSRTAALVSRTGSIDWLCLPALDSPSCFANLLGTPEHGRWLLTAPDATDVTRAYDGGSFVLTTEYTTATGRARVTEWMPMEDERADVLRRIEGLEGTVAFHHELAIRFGYGTVVPWVRRTEDPGGVAVIRAVAGPDALTLHGDRLPRATGTHHEDDFEVRGGERLQFSLTWTPSWADGPEALPADDYLGATTGIWDAWASACEYRGPHADVVKRSLLVLRLLTNDETGGIAAAATTSLPEEFGGVRNWDYRYCWLRDAALTLEALLDFGYREEADGWRSWLLRAVAGDYEDLQIMYRIDGGRDLPERELPHLPGYAASTPVRIGNGAVGQVQNDVLGEVMVALDQAREAGLVETEDSWSLQVHLVQDMLDRWRGPDHGIWEIRGEKQHFTQSKVMCWAAVDRAIRGVEVHGLPGPIEQWRAARDEIRADVLAHGYDPDANTFTQHYGSTEVDASLLQLLQVGFLPADDPRIVGTVTRIDADLADGPHVMRYHTATGVDGLPAGEHHFYACSFWLVDALARIGRADEAAARMTALVATVNDLGLLAEEYDPVNTRFAGNFPQALSHLALVRAAYTLEALS